MDAHGGINVSIPDHVKQGEAARLFPVLSESSREGRATSVLLATLGVVDTLADALFRRLGRPIGKRAKVQCFTEVVLKSDPKFRPDGLVIVDSGRDVWSALVECKVGREVVRAEQLEAYLRKARENGIDCVLTISNELVADPRRPPVTIDGRLTKSVSNYHYSWLAIRSEAEIAYAQKLVSDPEKNYILAELIRFLSHPSTGVQGFGQMPECWPTIVNEIGAGHVPSRSDARTLEIADAWLQEEMEISLILSRLVSRRCVSRSERRLAKQDPREAVAAELEEKQSLITDFEIPDAAAPIVVRADLRSRLTRIAMTLRAPEDRKRPDARLNWLLAQLKTTDPKGVDIVAHWPGRARSTMAPLHRLREDTGPLLGQVSGLIPYAFDVVYTCHTPGSFVGRKRFLTDLETAIQHFYTVAGRHLGAWAPKAPPPAARTAAEVIEEASAIDAERRTVESLALVLETFGQSRESPPTELETFDGNSPVDDRVEDAGEAAEPDHHPRAES